MINFSQFHTLTGYKFINTKGALKFYMRHKFLTLLIISLFVMLPVESFALDASLPDKATLSANRMRFDAYTGDFLADGNVNIQAGEFNVKAPIGTGNVERREVNFDKGITASGKWQGDKVDLKAGKLLLSFANVPTCKFQNGVKGGIGSMRIDADRLTVSGFGGVDEPSGADRQTKFWLVKVRNLEDKSQGMSFGADTVEGVLKYGELQEMTAKKGVWLRGKPKNKGDAVSLKGDHALYSLARGSVVVSGHVVAVQGGRTLKSDSVVYFPEQNRVEALGGITRDRGGQTTTERAEITIDLTRERKNNNKKPAGTQIEIQPNNENEKTQSQNQKKTRTVRTRKK